ncbi:hypothetical protein SORBI_3002G352401 [Sorghum bicolor]|uniref:Uncharacterized protein n=3 Tax=Sorghum bicolor TaxID=4558 RepID=A0A109ND26_SORBI|nr:hypothetical protein SORBI_3002G352401 [Sorghum bicolor]
MRPGQALYLNAPKFSSDISLHHLITNLQIHHKIMASSTMRTGLLFVVVVAAIHAFATSTMAETTPINVNDPVYQKIARWAVTEHVMLANDGLKFNKLVSGEVYVSLGYLYHLIIDASDRDGKDARYTAVVRQSTLGGELSLWSFKPAN